MTKMKINREQLPVKAHFFFFMAGLAPILPFIPVFGKELGISPLAMGLVTSVLPVLYLMTKTLLGLIFDYFRKWKKMIFIGLIAMTSLCFVALYFLPVTPEPVSVNQKFIEIDYKIIPACEEQKVVPNDNSGTLAQCITNCPGSKETYDIIYFYGSQGADIHTAHSCIMVSNFSLPDNSVRCNSTCKNIDSDKCSHCLYSSITFWGFVVLIALGYIGFNAGNSISDAVCFNVLGKGKEMSYGRQRVWGSIGWGISALLAGYSMDWWLKFFGVNSYAPAFLLVIFFTILDILCCAKIDIPEISGSGEILKDVYKLIKMRPIVIFLCFATLVGIIDSFIIYFLFWYVEDLAKTTNFFSDVKLIEGYILFAETLGGEVIFFTLSGKIIKKFGFGYTFVFCFFCYFIRLFLISTAVNPWWIIPIEFIMQGPTYALCYTTIVSYASKIAPPGTTATVQGIVAGMDDGLGFAVGSLVGGFLYKEFGGAHSFKIFSNVALAAAFLYFIVHILYLKHYMPFDSTKENNFSSPTEQYETVRINEL